ncbi:MAG: hypothetical protein A2Y21_09370 [Clostridiales bacterium GWC2_40_7]|nr:MAG: hypothetical protein A2Y21_09370 [Clostridiales bacterium GWC2_40_7]
MHYLLQNWIDQHLRPNEIDFTIDLYDETSNKFIVLIKRTNDTYIVVSYDGEKIKVILPYQLITEDMG